MFGRTYFDRTDAKRIVRRMWVFRRAVLLGMATAKACQGDGIDADGKGRRTVCILSDTYCLERQEY